MSDKSKFKRYCIGTVAEDLITGNKAIKIYPHEHVANIEGEIDKVDSVNKQSKDSENKSYNVSVDTKNTITAIWLNHNSNRVTPPNVRAGEKVEVYQYDNTDKYYWMTMGNELDLRGLEHVEYVYVNDPEAKVINDKNSYKVIYSTLNKLVGFRTADNDGEATTYEKMLDTKNGVDILVLDGFGNSIILNSNEGGLNITTNTHVTIKTSTANIETENCNITATAECNVEGTNVNLKATTLKITAGTMSIN
jgi:hypothetical protein